MNETDLSNYDLGDFVADEHFVEWVLRPDLQSDAFWTQWQIENPEQEKKIHEARLLVLLMQSRKIRMQEHQKDNLWKNIQMQTTEKEVVKKRASRRDFILYAAAACIALFLMVLGVVYLNLDPGNEYIVAENKPGKTSVIYLEDGTKVWLNADSKLSYLKSFEQESARTVMLEGEAFFDVAEDKNKPFIVNTRQMNVKVLGTAFNVKAFASDEKIETTLLRGKVEASSTELDSRPVVLARNQRAVLNKKTNHIAVQNVNAEDVAAWKDGVLIFDNTSFAEVKASLERKYGVQITLEDHQSLKCHFSGVVKDEPITEVLALLQTTSKITYEIKGTAIRLRGSLCQNS
jgi:ferric-dicitrate binding protein FerR (iron transport regulator)